MQAIASLIIGGTLLTGGVGSVIGTLFGAMSLKTINNIVIASGLREPYWQSITTSLMLCFFILLQSVILALRKKSSVRNGNKLKKV
jgi:simple sugar transport system permease protein